MPNNYFPIIILCFLIQHLIRLKAGIRLRRLNKLAHFADKESEESDSSRNHRVT